MTKKARLGRGLGALLGDVQTTTQNEAPPAAPSQNKTSDSSQVGESFEGYREIPIEQLQHGRFQPRVHIDKEALAELRDSIKSQGILQPLLVRPIARDQYEIIAGERRWRGAQLAGLQSVPAVVREINDQNAMAVGLIENIQREDLNAIEEARGYQRLLDEFELTHQEISDAVGCSRTAVSNLLRLLALHPAVQKMLESKVIDMGHARALLGLLESQQPEAANKVASGGLSVRQTEHLVKRLNRTKPGKASTTAEANQSRADVTRLEDELSTRIGARVDIQHSAKKGKLIIHYHSLDELDGILGRIK